MIRQVMIRNFKSIRDQTVNLSPVTVLVGRSGSGKSTFLQAMEFIRDFVRGNGAGGELKAAYRPFAKLYKNGSVAEFAIRFQLPGMKDEFSYFFRLRVHESHQIKLAAESLAVGQEVVFEQDTKPSSKTSPDIEWKVPPPLTQVPQPGALALGRLPGIEAASTAYAVLATGIGVHRFPLDVMQHKTSNGATELDRQHQRFGLDDIGSNYLSVLQSLYLQVDQAVSRKTMIASLQRLNRSIRSVDLESLQELKGAVVGHTIGDRVMPLRLEEESDGFRRFFAHMLALYQQPPRQTLLFEEPENGIYPGALQLLADEFQAAPDAGRGQVILTTHSPRLLDNFEAEQIRVVELNDNLETVIGELASDQRDAILNQLLSPGELLDVDPARREVAST
ncbi:MAG TPA: AAA family ATPase [Planctomycetaceae bacterium]|nr:AAA family ATPase [Planctomycetaceae bacterium]